MSKDPLSKIRASDTYRALARVLKEYGIAHHEVVDRRPHPKLVFEYAGDMREFEFPGTPSSQNTPKRETGELRRALRGWKLAVPTARSNQQVDMLGYRVIDADRSARGTVGANDGSLNPDFDVGLHMVEDEPRVLDVDLGMRLGMDRPTNIRQVIERNAKELADFGPCISRVHAHPTVPGRDVTCFYLNEEQALLLATLSRAPRSREVRAMLIRVFVAWRRGRLTGVADREVHGGIVKAVVRKAIDDLVPTILRQIVADMVPNLVGDVMRESLLGILPQMVEQRVSSSQFAVTEGWTAGEVLDEAGVQDRKGLRGLSTAVSGRLHRFHASRGVAVRLGRLGSTSAFVFDPTVCRDWLRTGGREFINRYVAERRGQKSFRLIGGDARQPAPSGDSQGA